MNHELISSVRKTVDIFGVKVASTTLEELIELILNTIEYREKLILSYINVYALNLAYEDHAYKNYLKRSDIIFCDGIGVKIAAKFLNGTNLHRHTPPDWFPELALKCAAAGHSFFFLGAGDGVTQKAAQILKQQNPNIKIHGTHHGYFDKSVDGIQNECVVDEINRLSPNILLVGFGMPIQERWIYENAARLNVNIILPVGAFFDYYTGDVIRAPRWMTDHGFEWLGRLIIEPRRLWKRYVIGNPLFFWRILKQKIGWEKYPE